MTVNFRRHFEIVLNSYRVHFLRSAVAPECGLRAIMDCQNPRNPQKREHLQNRPTAPPLGRTSGFLIDHRSNMERYRED